MVYVQKRIALGVKMLQYFTMRVWIFRSTNFQALNKILSPEEELMCVEFRLYFVVILSIIYFHLGFQLTLNRNMTFINIFTTVCWEEEFIVQMIQYLQFQEHGSY